MRDPTRLVKLLLFLFQTAFFSQKHGFEKSGFFFSCDLFQILRPKRAQFRKLLKKEIFLCLDHSKLCFFQDHTDAPGFIIGPLVKLTGIGSLFQRRIASCCFYFVSDF